MSKKVVVVHSGGMDSSLCLYMAMQEFGKENVLSLSFDYNQRHATPELTQAKKICKDWEVDHLVIPIGCMQQITKDALTHPELEIDAGTLVVGRNGLMARLAAIHADSLGAQILYMGVMGLEEANCGYRDCSRSYMDKMQEILRIDLANPQFEIRTPLVELTKAQTCSLADRLGILDYLFENTITCYNGLPREGCGTCPACKLRNAGFEEYRASSV